MDIVIIGSGNVAAVLGRKFVAAGHQIQQIVSRNAMAASELAYEWNTESANYLSLVNKNADIYIIAVADKAIMQVAKDLSLKAKVVAHTAATVGMDVLKNITDDYGVFYPLQSLTKEQTNLPEIPIYIEAATEKANRSLQSLAQSIGQKDTFIADLDKRTKLHTCAVVVNNFTNYIFYLAENYCKKEGIDFNTLLPLINNTFNRIRQFSPAAMQTGPAVRADLETIQKHRELLKNHPQLLKLYDFFTTSIGESALSNET